MSGPGLPALPATAASETQRMIESLPSPLDPIADLRSAAKWTLAAVGAVGAVLLGGAPLTAIGTVHGTRHLLFAGGGLVLALIGVALSIWTTSRVLAPRLTTAKTLTSPKLSPLRNELSLSEGDVEKILNRPEQDRQIAANLARQAAAPGARRRRAEYEHQYARVTANAARAEESAQRLLDLSHAWLIAQDLKVSRRCTFLGGLLVVAGAVLFFLATGNTGPTYVPVLTPQITSTAPAAPHSPSPAPTPSPAATP